jgi:hypothetical protein
MVFGTRHTAGLGDSALFLRLSRLGQFWDWIAGEIVTGESSDTALYVIEYPNSGDAVQSWYGADITVPAGGPWTVEIVEASTGATIATDSTVLADRTLLAAEYATEAMLGAASGLVTRSYRAVLALLAGKRSGGRQGAGARVIERYDDPGRVAVSLPVTDQHGNTSDRGTIDLED